MAATMDAAVPAAGAPLPPGWHWAWFNEAEPVAGLGSDGHARPGDFLPPVPLARRMWAGGRIWFHAPITVGSQITRRSVIKSITQKSGRSGPLCFIVVSHDYLDGDKLCLSEEHDLVYRSPFKPGSLAPQPRKAPDEAGLSREINPDPVWLFRYSALTFNGHRIHYDVDYAREVEGYAGLVVHAPLLATLLMGLAGEIAEAGDISSFSYRAIAPLFDTRAFHIHARQDSESIDVWACDPDGRLAMSGEATLRA